MEMDNAPSRSPLDYVLRYAACDYHCYHQGRYVVAEPRFPKRLKQSYETIEGRTPPPSRHQLRTPPDDLQEELCVIAARLHALAGQLAGHPAEHAPQRAQLAIGAHPHLRSTPRPAGRRAVNWACRADGG